MNWKDKAKRHIAQYELLKCLTLMKKHGIDTRFFVERFKVMKRMEDKVLSEKRTYTMAEYAKNTSIFTSLQSGMIKAINEAI